MCVSATCPPRKECETRRSACNHAIGLCDVPPLKPNGTVCSKGSCQGGVCAGVGGAEPRCRLYGPFKFDHSCNNQADS
jgi:hypothetical protein